MKPAALAAGLVALACCAKAQGQSFSDLALDGRPERMQRLVAGGKKEGALTLYTSIPEKDMAVLAADFDKRYGVKVNVWRASSVKVLQRAAAEARANRWETVSRDRCDGRLVGEERPYAARQPGRLGRSAARADRLQLPHRAVEERGRSGRMVRHRSGDRPVERRRRFQAAAASQRRLALLRIPDQRRAAADGENELPCSGHQDRIVPARGESPVHRPAHAARGARPLREGVRRAERGARGALRVGGLLFERLAADNPLAQRPQRREPAPYDRAPAVMRAQPIGERRTETIVPLHE